ncbi:MAG: pilin [Azonexus sp.]|nr:pilin [Azonexus sp.]
MAEGMTLAGGAKASITEFRSSEGKWPPSQASAGLAAAASIVGNAVTSVAVTADTGVITITYNDKVKAGDTLVMTPTTGTGGSVTWDCKAGGTVQAKWRPATCR